MKNFLVTAAIILAAAAAAWGGFFWLRRDAALCEAARQRDAMGWLRVEFHLDDARYAAIERLHRDYDVICAGHCMAIMAARRELAEVRQASPADPAAIAAAERTVTERERACTDALRIHLRRVAGLMPTGEGERYLRMLLPRVDTFDHQGPPTVRLDR